ncbi:MAG: NAD-dependent epimerase/dehydratase family protein [Thermoplasmata archaeon]
MPRRGTRPLVVVTGGAGAIGSALTEELARRGNSVRVVDNLSSPIPHVRNRWRRMPHVRLRRADVRRPLPVLSAVRGATAVWHLAANPDIRLGTRRPRIDLEVGVLGMFNVLEAARRWDVPQVLFSSSSVVYGLPDRFPTPEDYGPLCPESIYGGSKLAAEALLSSFCYSYGIRGHIFRFANVIGRTMTHGVIVDFFEKLANDPARLEVLGDGFQAKSYLRTEDCVSAMMLAAEKATARVNIFNLGTRDQTSVREIAESVVRVHGGRARIEYAGGDRGWVGDIPKQLLATDRIVALGWQPRSSSAEAVQLTVEEIAHDRGVHAKE